MPKLLNALGRDELEHRWQQGRFIVPAMTRTELREAIEKPAEDAGCCTLNLNG